MKSRSTDLCIAAFVPAFTTPPPQVWGAALCPSALTSQPVESEQDAAFG